MTGKLKPGCRTRRSSGHGGGFTLLELLAVLLLVAVLTATAVLSLRGPYQAAQLQSAIEQYALIDRQIREHCRRYGASQAVTFDLDAGRFEGPEFIGTVLPPVTRVDAIWTSQGKAEHGRIILEFSAWAQTRTYAVRMRNGAGARWVLFTGITGESHCLDHEDELVQLFEVLAAARADAA